MEPFPLFDVKVLEIHPMQSGVRVVDLIATEPHLKLSTEHPNTVENAEDRYPPPIRIGMTAEEAEKLEIGKTYKVKLHRNPDA